MINNCGICNKELFRSVNEKRSGLCSECKEIYFYCKKCDSYKNRDLLNIGSNSICIDCAEKSVKTFICKDCNKEIKVKCRNQEKNHKISRCKECKRKRKKLIESQISGELIICSKCKKNVQVMTSSHIESCFSMTYDEFLNKYGKDAIYSEKYRNRMKKSSIEACTDEVKQKISTKCQEWWQNDDNKKRLSESLKIAQNTDEAVNNHRIGFYNYLANETQEHKQERINVAKQSWLDPEVKRKRIIGIFKDNQPITGIAIKLSNALKAKNVNNVFEFMVDYYSIDIAIPEFKIAIECDGNYWHGNPKYYPTLTIKQTKKQITDKARNIFLVNKGWSVLRFWEDEINNNLDDCVNKILQQLEENKRCINERVYTYA